MKHDSSDYTHHYWRACSSTREDYEMIGSVEKYYNYTDNNIIETGKNTGESARVLRILAITSYQIERHLILLR